MIGLSATGATTSSSPRTRSFNVGKACSLHALHGSLRCRCHRIQMAWARIGRATRTHASVRIGSGVGVIFVAIDIGGTFTDLVGFDATAGRFVEAKSLTTPAQLVQGIVDCIRKSGLDAGAIDELIHGSTIAINTLIERKGAKTGLLVTRGTRDVYIIGRGNRPEAYNLFFHRHRPLVARRLTHEIEERLTAEGETYEPLQRGSVAKACAALKAEGVEAVAVCFLHAYGNPAHERIAGEMIRAAMPDAYLSLSHEILREYREFERMSTTVVNAYIGPNVGGYASGHPVMLPMIDVVEVGAGGGSIAWLDDVGALKVGPQSAGADPGPICYRGGGAEPTITDANVVLGRLDPDNFLGGEMKLDGEGARSGIAEKIGRPLQLDTVAAAQAIVEIAISKMSLAVREVSVAKGYDPRDFALVASGGAGPLHVVAIARELHIPKVVVPLFPSHFSAVGMLLADERHDFIRTVYGDLSGVDFGSLIAAHDEMVADAEANLRHGKQAEHQIHLDLRYLGQEFTLSVPVTLAQLKSADHRAIRTAFDALYEHRYAHHSPEEPVEMVNIRLAAVGKRTKLAFPAVGRTAAATPASRRKAYFASAAEPVVCPVYRREDLGAGAEIVGTALIQEHGTTTVLFDDDRCQVAASGELIITVGGV